MARYQLSNLSWPDKSIKSGPNNWKSKTGKIYTLKAGHKVLSYATRGMEPLRGFPEFIKALPQLLAEDPNLQVVIAGADRRAYSYDAPSHNGSWREHLLAELGDFTGRERITFTGLLTYTDYRPSLAHQFTLLSDKALRD